MSLTYTYFEEDKPVKTAHLKQPKGSLDLTINLNNKGNRIRIANKNDMVVNVATDKLDDFIAALNRVKKTGVKVSQRKAA